jgi:glycosyltransferase involved in cell wall biosynthesis
VHEALASGTGVIASTEVGCVDDLIEPGVTGAIVPTDAGALAATTLSWLWSGGADADACRAHARRITYATATEELERTVAEVLAG